MLKKMDKKQSYTALSRTTKFDYIHLNFKDFNNLYVNRKQPHLKLIHISVFYTKMEKFTELILKMEACISVQLVKN